MQQDLALYGLTKLYNILSMKVLPLFRPTDRHSYVDAVTPLLTTWKHPHAPAVPTIAIAGLQAEELNLTNTLINGRFACVTQEFHTRLVQDGVEAFAAQPGIANTELFGKIHPEASKPIGSAIVCVPHCQCYHLNKPALPDRTSTTLC